MTRRPQRRVDGFNARHPVGTPVRYWPGFIEGDGTPSVTRSKAWLLGAHTPVVMVEGHAGGIALTHVVPEERDIPCCPGSGSMAHVRGCVNHPEAGRG